MKKQFDYIWTDKKRVIFGLPISFTRYFITEDKFIRRTGFLNIIEEEFELYKVTDKNLMLSFWERLCGCGSIKIMAKDVDTPILIIDTVKKPRNVLKILEDNINIQRDKYKIRGRDMVGAGSDYEQAD